MDQKSPLELLTSIRVPDRLCKTWQKSLNILAETVGVPVALVMRAHPDGLEVFSRSNHQADGPPPGRRYDFGTGHYCETVLRENTDLLVADASADPRWNRGPLAKEGMISYLGLPLLWPSGEVFGTLCLLDRRPNGFSPLFRQLLDQFRDLIEMEIASLYQRDRLSGELVEQRSIEQSLQRDREKLEDDVRHQTQQLDEAHRQLSEAELKYRTMADSARDWIYWTRPDHTFHYIAPSCRAITGYSPEEFEQSPSLLREIVVPEDLARWEKHRRTCHQKKLPGQLQIRIRRKDGRIVWVEHVCGPVQDERGKFLGTRASNRDITERKQAEAERRITVWLLRRANAARSMRELLRGVVSHFKNFSGCAAVGIRLRDGDEFPYYETRGLSSQFVVDENHLCVRDEQGCLQCDEQGNPILECICGKVLRGETDPRLPYFTSGGSFWVNSTSDLIASISEADARAARIRNNCHREGYESVALIPLRIADETFGLLQFNDSRKGMFSAFLVELFERLAYGVASAVAQQRALQALRTNQKKLRRRQQSLAEVQHIARLGSWIWNIRTNQVAWSDEAFRIFGFRPREFPPTYDLFLKCVHPDDRESVGRAVDRALADPDNRYHVEHRVIRPDGVERTVLERGTVRFDSSGRPIRMIGTVHDITENKQSERQLRAALQEVEYLKERLYAENVYLQEEIKSAHDFDEIVGQSHPLRATLRKVDSVAVTDTEVLLLGETGTGKELLARAIHNRSARKDRPLVKVNCAALPASLIESELFGHVRGAFTGAIADKIGRFELADGGTLFLDEIGELDLALQTKLLRVLQEGEFERIGRAETHRVDVRIIAATNRDLRRAVEEKLFRADLYYRLAVFPIEVPPLRRRRDDIPLLIWHFISKKRVRLGKTITSIPRDVMQTLTDYDWPGNIRELENVIERAMILSPGTELMLSESLVPAVERQAGDRHPAERVSAAVSTSAPRNLAEVDRAHILEVLDQCDWKIKGTGNAAERLGLKPSTLRYRMRKLGIDRPRHPR